jgi:multidrug efflux pump
MYLCGYSLNNLSLMALTVATGFVVDDAIVVLENVSRKLEAGVPKWRAALEGTREVGFTVISMSLSLIAVFIPILLMGGVVGRYFREFAMVLSGAILISLLVSLTTTPMMCAQLLRPKPEKARGRFDRGAERVFNWFLRGYEKSLAWSLRHSLLILITLFVTIGLNVWLYTIVPKGFFPQQDTGRLFGFIRGDQSISFQAMREKLNRFVEVVRADPAVELVGASTGGGGGFGGARNSGSMFVTLKSRADRDYVTADQVIARLRRQLEREPGANLFLTAAQDFRIGGRQGQAQWQFTMLADDLEELRRWEPRVRRALAGLPELADVSTDQQDKGLQTSLVIDRDTASRLGITPRMIDAALNNAFGQRQVSTIYNPLNQYRVVMEAAPEYWQSPEALKSIYIVLPNGGQVPLSAISHYEMTNTPLSVPHQGLFPATTVSFNLTEGVSLSQAREAVMQELARIGVPTTIHANFQGTARVFEQSLKNQPILILLALVTIYLVLGILYESLIHPITILSTLPSAGVGALLALLLFNTEFTIIPMIGVILLIGIVKKNAIMMIDFALELERTEGISSRESIYRAAVMRFRPIMMTTMAAALGALPLAIGFGEGSELRRPLGIAIVGGLALSQLLTLYTTPVVYLYLDRARLWAKRRRDRRALTPAHAT